MEKIVWSKLFVALILTNSPINAILTKQYVRSPKLTFKLFTTTSSLFTITSYLIWGRSSAGRALEWHSRGHRFDPDRLHQREESSISYSLFV